MRIVPVLLSGGVGSRLWPLSRSSAPKQLQALLGERTMLQATVERVQGMDGVEAPLVVCNRLHVQAVVDQLDEVDASPSLVVAEPVARNTAPAVAAAALTAPDDCVLAVLPADHVITRTGVFQQALDTAAEQAAEGRLVTFGIVPHRPETGYGYIEVGEATGDVRKVERFVEKPDPETAARYLEGGRHLWNSGMFVFSPDAVREELDRHAPDVLEAVTASLAGLEPRGGPATRVVEPGPEFGAAPSISIDHAVMEHTRRAVVVPLDAGWSDVGSWTALWEIEDRDADSNVVRGDVELVDVHGSYVRSTDRLVAVIGLDDVVVVETADAVLVADRRRVQDVKAVVERLTAAERPEVE